MRKIKLLIGNDPKEIQLSNEITARTPLKEVTQLIRKEVKDNDIILIPARMADLNADMPLQHYLDHVAQHETYSFRVYAQSKAAESVINALPLMYWSLDQLCKSDVARANLKLYATTFDTLPSDIRSFFLIQLASVVDMRGRTFADISGLSDDRRTMQVHPYVCPTFGSHAVPIGTDEKTQIHIALIDNSDRNTIETPQGYNGFAACAPYPSAAAGQVYDIHPPGMTHEQMNRAEILVLKGKTPREAYPPTAEIKAAPLQLVSNTDPIFDKNPRQTAARELFEEADLRLDESQLTSVGVIPLYRNMAEIFLAKVPSGNLPEIKGNGTETRDAFWVPASQFQLVKDANPKSSGFKVTVSYIPRGGSKLVQADLSTVNALVIGRALREYRNQAIQEATKIDGDPLFNEPRNVIAALKKLFKDHGLQHEFISIKDQVFQSIDYKATLPVELESDKQNIQDALAHFGADADRYYKQLTLVAKQLAQGAPFEAIFPNLEGIIINHPAAIAKQTAAAAIPANPGAAPGPEMKAELQRPQTAAENRALVAATGSLTLRAPLVDAAVSADAADSEFAGAWQFGA